MGFLINIVDGTRDFRGKEKYGNWFNDKNGTCVIYMYMHIRTYTLETHTRTRVHATWIF